MEIFSINASLFWFLFGVAFLVFEMITPGFVLLFFGLGAWVVSGLIYFLPIAPSFQVLVFISSSIFLLFVLRRKLKVVFKGRQNTDNNFDDAVIKGQYIGREVTILEEISPDKPGRAELNGTSWQAKTAGPSFAIGARAKVVQLDGLTLVLEALSS